LDPGGFIRALASISFSRRAALLLVALAGALLGPKLALAQETSPLPAEETGLFGKTVVSLGYTTDGPVDREEVVHLIAIKAGEPLTEDATGATIRNLYATSDYAEVLVDAAEAPGGVAVTVALYLAYRVSPLKFSTAPVPRAELRRVLPFSEGDPLQRDAVEQGASDLQRRLTEDGFLNAKVSPEVSYDPKTFHALVLYRIEPGKPARTAPPFFDGDTAPFGQAELLKKARLKPGKRYRESKARADATRMTEFLHKQSRLRGSVELIAAQPTDDGRLMPVYRVTVGPDVAIEAKGIKAKTVRNDLHALLEGQTFDEDLVLLYVEQKRKDLQASGHYRAKVDYTWNLTPEKLVVGVDVEEGPEYAVEKIAFEGNRSIKDKDLLKVMVTHTKGIPLLRRGHLEDDDLAGDLSALQGYYQARGWVTVKIDKPRITEGSKPHRLVVTIPIEEGPRTVVADVRVVGAEHAADAAAEKTLKIKRGAFYNPFLVREDLGNLQAFYHDHGWREASVKDDVSLQSEGTRAEVIYRVEEGTRTFFGKTIVRGNYRTRIHRITRLLAWKEGQPMSEADLLQTQRNLSRAGVFRRIDIRPQPPDPKTQVRNVNLELQEGRPLSVLYGIGYQYAPDASQNRSDPYAIVGASYNNLFGRMQSASIEAQFAPISLRERFQASFREPYLFNTQYPLTFLTYYMVEPIQDVDIRRLGAILETSRYYGKYLRLALRYAYERINPVNPSDLSNIEKEDFPRSDQPIEQSTIGPNGFYDRRDDIIDPHRGYYATAAYKYAFPFLSAVARYHKVTVQTAWFQQVFGSVFAVAARAGAIWPYGPSDIQVPIAERNFAGGRSTNRAFDTDVLGIPGSTVDWDTHATLRTDGKQGSCAGAYPVLANYDCDAGPHIVGGNGFLSFNAELRIPIFGHFGVTLFYDLSQVWASVSEMNLRIEGADGLRQGAGLGLRYVTPIGPLRAEYGWPVNARTIPFKVTTTDANNNVISPPECANGGCTGTVKETGRFFFSIGYPF
jgi:outer membrane protein insertion porin family